MGVADVTFSKRIDSVMEAPDVDGVGSMVIRFERPFPRVDRRGIIEIVLKDIDAKSGSRRDDAFRFIGDDDFHGRKGELQAEETGRGDGRRRLRGAGRRERRPRGGRRDLGGAGERRCAGGRGRHPPDVGALP